MSPKLCSIDGCGRHHLARGWCSLHYNRWRSNGDPLLSHVCRTGWDGNCRQCGSEGPFYPRETICKKCRNQQRIKARKDDIGIHEATKARNRRYARQKHQERREQVIRHYGSVCSCCGEDHSAFLAVDHVDGGGNAHRRELGKGKMVGSSTFYRWLIESGFPDGFQVLCHNCNFAKSHHPGGCPHALDPDA